MKSNRKKILFVLTGSYPLFNPSINLPHGGAEIDTYNIARYLDKDKFEIHFIVGDFGQNKVEIIDGIKIHRWAKIENNGLLKGFFNLIGLLKLAIKINPDIIFSKGVNWLSIELILIGMIMRKKIVIKSTHLRNIDGTLNSTIRGKIFSKIINIINVFILQNYSDREIFLKNYPHYKNRTEIIRNFQIIPDFLQRNFSKNFLWIGRPEKFKRPEIFLNLAESFPDFHFTMIMPYTKNEIFLNCKKKAAKIKNLKFIPGLPGEKIAEHYLINSFLISTSENEGFPNIILEAMKYGTPIISFLDFDNIIKKNNCGKIINSVEDAKDFIQKISPDEWKRMSENCYNFAKENFNAEIGAKEYEELFRVI